MSANHTDLQRLIADAMMAHALAAEAIEDGLDGHGSDRARRLASLDAALAGQLEVLGVDLETMAGAMALLALELAARKSRTMDDAGAVCVRVRSARS